METIIGETIAEWGIFDRSDIGKKRDRLMGKMYRGKAELKN
jgi:hypothetical protein